MILGFTGTRQGMTDAQLRAFIAYIGPLRPYEFHHGDCYGADDQATEQAAFFKLHGWHDRCEIIAHPSNIPDPRNGSLYNDVVHLSLPPLVRNRVIVDTCTHLIACPDGPERVRSGTWSTVRYARKQNERLPDPRPIIIVWPDGTVKPDHPKDQP